MISDPLAAELVQSALGVPSRRLTRQTLTQSGNAVYHIILADDREMALRISPRPTTFAYLPHHLKMLHALGLPVQRELAHGPTPAGGSFTLLTWIPGRDLLYELPTMRPDQIMRVAQTIADYQHRVGTLPASTGFGWAPIGKNASVAKWTDIFGAPSAPILLPDDAPALDHLRARLRAIRHTLEPYFANIRPTCFLDDLTVKNVLVQGGTLQGIIDFDFVCYGDPLMSVGTTLALIATQVGDAARFYGEELIRCWNPTPDALLAIRFYAALWTIGMISAAESARQTARAQELVPIAGALLQLAED